MLQKHKIPPASHLPTITNMCHTQSLSILPQLKSKTLSTITRISIIISLTCFRTKLWQKSYIESCLFFIKSKNTLSPNLKHWDQSHRSCLAKNKATMYCHALSGIVCNSYKLYTSSPHSIAILQANSSTCKPIFMKFRHFLKHSRLPSFSSWTTAYRTTLKNHMNPHKIHTTLQLVPYTTYK